MLTYIMDRSRLNRLVHFYMGSTCSSKGCNTCSSQRAPTAGGRLRHGAGPPALDPHAARLLRHRAGLPRRLPSAGLPAPPRRACQGSPRSRSGPERRRPRSRKMKGWPCVTQEEVRVRRFSTNSCLRERVACPPFTAIFRGGSYHHLPLEKHIFRDE